ncbi:SDR family NAD(P)-dependent oxidoreductase [Nonomuraea angiospora]|uniref:SDR family oxidoreductase n=1 Tax=Nonomuraea angiospora TaxID=46172 RepID=UPI00344B2A11
MPVERADRDPGPLGHGLQRRLKTPLAIIGAGPGIGLAVARRFGKEGFEVSLVSRSQDRLAALVAQLGDVRATAHAADLTDERSLEAALADIGPVDVLVYNGAGAVRALTSVLEVTRESAQDAFDSAVLGAVTAVRAVLPHMLERGSGTLLFTSGISAVHPLPFLGNVGIAVSGLRNYALSLAVAETHWRLHTARDLHEVVLGDLATVKAAISAL